jgi:hypothetical protein
MKVTHREDGSGATVTELPKPWVGWTFHVVTGTGPDTAVKAGAHALTIIAPPGELASAGKYSEAPLGLVFAAARAKLFSEPAIAAAIQSLPEPIDTSTRGVARLEHVATAYRAALRHKANAASTVAAYLQLSNAKSAERLITRARAAGILRDRETELADHQGRQGWWRIGGRLVNRPPTAEEIRREVAALRGIERISEHAPNLKRTTSRKGTK